MVLKKIIPLAIRIKIRRILRMLMNCIAPYDYAKKYSNETFPFAVASYRSQIVKVWDGVVMELQQGKKENIAIASPKLHNLVIAPEEVFSFYTCVGSVTKRKGYKLGYEMSGSEISQGIGGGLCQLANSILWVMLNSGFEIIERHRHEYDLFPDSNRTIPFGVGVSIFYNYRDLRMRNPHTHFFKLHIIIKDNILETRLYAASPLDKKYSIIEKNHSYRKENEHVYRFNEIYQVVEQNNTKIEKLLWKNYCLVKYPIEL